MPRFYKESRSMPLAQADDSVKLHYTTVGEGSTNLIFMHCWAGSGNIFNEMINYLDLSSVRAIKVDLRGHGDSDKPETGFSNEQFAKDILAIADDVQADQFVIVGFSMSGKFAQYVP